MRLCLSLAFVALFAPPLCAEYSLQAIDDAVREMAIYQVDVREDIALFNNQLSYTIALSRKDHTIETNQERDLLGESTILYQVLQDYYSKDSALFDYLEGLFEGYNAILKEALQVPHLAPLIPLLHEIVDQLQTMAKLEHKLTALINE
ncbi:hypothetical protein NHP190003_12520 [Helicobacter sp. NHP19-003]|uniref:Uncharacterized protein n=1 Tax=Helicobacter gastrocanis TaxID=2849641 RepID=A0ABM7SC59_9HELI|nr:hypothetical protein [Helicobacter sp. NHP19-003]BCZ17970.1 hypothetical protein NHP190003_12520 [Helicobacter sp. NHP19-003]